MLGHNISKRHFEGKGLDGLSMKLPWISKSARKGRMLLVHVDPCKQGELGGAVSTHTLNVTMLVVSTSTKTWIVFSCDVSVPPKSFQSLRT